MAEGGKTKLSVAPSALVYLFGDKLENTFAKHSKLAVSEKLPCRDVKVKKKDLTAAMFVADLVHLAQEGSINLTTGKTGLIFKSDAVFVGRGEQPKNPENLGRQVLANLDSNEKKNDARSIIWRVLGRNTRDPWGQVIMETQSYLITMGYFAKEARGGIAKILGDKTVPQCDKIVGLEKEVGAVQEMLMAFQSAQPGIYKLLWKGAENGIRSRLLSDDY